jgi:hypothetical protein
MNIQINEVYRFKKSGNLVRTVKATDYAGSGNWVVARIDTGKEMLVSGESLIDPNHPDWS